MIKKCQTKGCEETERLTKHSHRFNANGEKVYYYMCYTCNSSRHKKWYHQDPKNKERVMMSNLQSLAKKFGYKLVKE